MAGLESVGCPAFIVNARFDVVARNSVAETSDTAFFSLNNHHIKVAVEPEQLIFDKTLSEALDAQAPVSSVTVLSSMDGRRAVVRATPVQRALGFVFVGNHAMVWLRAFDADVLPTKEVVARIFGLTPAECQLAIALCSGDPLAVVAEKAGVTLHTARDRLKSVFAKTGTNRQAELVLLLQRLS